MLKKKELEVSIHCEGPFAPFVYRKLFRFNDAHKTHTALPSICISIDNLESQDDKVELQYVTYYDTLHIIDTIEVKRAKSLSAVFISIIYKSLRHLEDVGYDPLGDILVISAIPIEDQPNHYTLHCSFTD